ncbi:MAG: hypothetical protein L6R40_003982 [Gallowayella cf. fulva]|nr:MAG: hypothetical protein L6R40_003982 [Xanthomendoza cf. fulva]
MAGDSTVELLIASGFNQTLLNNTDLCTSLTCPKELQTIAYVPSLPGNAFFVALFSLLLILQLAFGYRWKTWSFTGSVFGGLALEIIGYVARIQIHDNPFKSDPFLMFVSSLSPLHLFPPSFGTRDRTSADDRIFRYLVVLTIAPCFLTAAIYLSLSRVILIHGEHLARFKPRTYTIIFICCDVFSLVLQAIGGALADTADDHDTEQTGINIMIAGLVFQVVSLTVFAALCADFFWSVRKHGGVSRSVLQARLPYSVGRFHLFIGCKDLTPFFFGGSGYLSLTNNLPTALALATLTIYIRSIFRVAELQGGFNGHLANDEVTFMILEGTMVAIASIALTLPHPGMVFGPNWNLKSARAKVAEASERGVGNGVEEKSSNESVALG